MSQPRSNTSDLQALLILAAEGDDNARGELIARAEQRLLSLTRRMLRNYSRLRRWEETNDVFQNAALRLYRSLADVRPESPNQFFGLATTQIRRSLLDLCRHHFGPQGEAGRHVSDVAVGGNDSAAPVGPITAGRAAPDGKPETFENWARFHEAVEQLEDDQRVVFEAVWYGGASYEEAADCVGISKRTVIRRVQRARQVIRDALRDEFPSTP